MSYFAFGLAELCLEARQDETRTSVWLAMERCAVNMRLAVALGGQTEPLILAEMRGQFAADSAIPFLCLAKPEEDTSDALVSPHLLGIDGASEGLLKVAHWVGCILQIEGVERVRIWFTEGWDDAFERHHCTIDDLAPLLVGRLQEENELPSMHLNVVSQATEAG